MFFEKLSVYEGKITEKKQEKSGILSDVFFDESTCAYHEWRVLRFFGVCKKMRKYSILLRAFVTDSEIPCMKFF